MKDCDMIEKFKILKKILFWKTLLYTNDFENFYFVANISKYHFILQ